MSADLPEDDSEIVTPLTEQQAKAFWQEFSVQLPALEALDGHAFVEQANDLLQAHASGLAIELVGKAGDAGSGLVISAHGNTAQFENVQTLVRYAPQFENYAVAAFRSRTLGADFAMRMDDFELSCSDVLAGYYNAGGITGLELAFAKEIPQDMVSHAQHMAFIMLDHILGEWDFSVRVGPVEFVDAISPDLNGPVPLPQLPAAFDAFVRDVLGRSYEYPPEADGRWLSLEIRPRDAGEDDAPDILSFYDSANAVATRADLSHFVEWRFPFESQEELDAVRDAQDALDAELARHQRGILVFSRVEKMNSRVAAFYVDDAAYATALAQQLGAQNAPDLKAQLSVSYDPAWNEYLSLYAAIHRQDEE